MKVSDVCKNYFSGFEEFSNFKKNDSKTTALAVLKIFSYVTLLIPLGFALVYGAASLYGRVYEKKQPSPKDKIVNDKAQVVLGPDVLKINTLLKVLEMYLPKYQPNKNRNNLLEYVYSEEYNQHANTARIYYNSKQLKGPDALRIISQREPTNIAMGPNQYHKESLKQLFGYYQGVYNDPEATKADGSLFNALPNTAAVYSETYLWDPPGGQNKKWIGCLSLPAPALDSMQQPHWKYYMETGKLDAQKYTEEMGFLFKTIEKVVRDNIGAVGSRQIKRVVLSRFGQGAFLGALSQADKQLAHNIYKEQMSYFIASMQDTNLKIVMSEYMDPGTDLWLSDIIIGDIVTTAQEGDLIVNAWDPHSAPGNGNDGDRSFDGAMGRGSGILLTQTAWLNPLLRNESSLVPVA